jgi:cellulose synthase/poly-beta-1,6-N-acetylglucosamine synthase-like glycosyltransferase
MFLFLQKRLLIVLLLSNRLTVGICAYNEAKNIEKLLNNVLKEQNLPADAEVLVVCSGCTDGTLETAQAIAAKDPRVKVFSEAERKGKASAINHMLAHAEGDLIVFVSADTQPDKGIFPRIVGRMQAQDVGVVCGNPVPVNSSGSLVDRFVRVLWSFHGHVFKELNDAGLARHATELFCMRRGIVNRIPAETVNDDAYIAVTAKKQGWLIKFEPTAKVFICGPKTFSEYFRQRRRIIRGHFQIRKLTGESPQYLIHLMPLHPVKVAKLASWLCTRCDALTLGAFLYTEFLVNFAAMADVASGKVPYRWSPLPSTKSVPLQPT